MTIIYRLGLNPFISSLTASSGTTLRRISLTRNQSNAQTVDRRPLEYLSFFLYRINLERQLSRRHIINEHIGVRPVA